MSTALSLSQSSPLALGTAGFGTGVSADDSFRLLDTYVAAGGNHLDTAHDYASWVPNGIGASERTLGDWLRKSGARSRVLLATKAGCTRGDKKRLKRDILREEVAISLDRLRLDRVDVLWLHRDDPAIPVDEILDWVEEMRRENRFVASAASNWSPARLDEACARAKARGIPGFVGSQVGWNLAALTANHFPTGDAHFVSAADEAWYVKTKFPLVAWESQAGGFFSGDYQPGVKPTSSRANVVIAHYANATNWRRLELARGMAKARGVSPNQIALAWMRQQPFPVISIVGPRLLSQLEDSLASLKVTLTAEELKKLRNPDVS